MNPATAAVTVAGCAITALIGWRALTHAIDNRLSVILAEAFDYDLDEELDYLPEGQP